MISIPQLLSQTDPETTLLLLTCRVYLQTEKRESLLSFLAQYSPAIDYKRFYLLASQHKVRPVVHSVLSGIPMDSVLIKRLEEDCKHITLSSFKNLKETERLIAVFKKRNSCLIPYRGSFFSKMYYGDWGLRESSDIDLLVKEEDLPAVLSFVEEEDFCSGLSAEDYRSRSLYKNGLSIDVNNDTATQRNTHLEFHYNISPAYCAIRGRYEDLVKEDSFFPLAGDKIRVLSNSATVKMLLVHHGLNDIWVSLKYYLDMAVLTRSFDINWEDVAVFCSENGIRDLSSAGLYNMELLLGIRSPLSCTQRQKDLAEQVRRFSLLKMQYHDQNGIKLYWRIKGRDSKRWKVKMLWGLFLILVRPSAEDFEWIYFPRPLFFLYYILKPFRLLNKFIIKKAISKKEEKPRLLFR